MTRRAGAWAAMIDTQRARLPAHPPVRPRPARPRRLPVGRRRACDGAVEAVAALREAGASVLFLTNDVRHAPEDFVRKLWRLGFQASLDEVVTAGAALQFQLAGRDGGSAFVVGTQALVDHVADAGLRIVNRTPFATRADVVVVGGARRLRLRRAADRDPGGAARRRADRRHARRHVPDARRAVARHRRRARRGRGGHRPPRRPRRRQARARDVRGGPRPPRRRAACWPSATCSTSTSRAPAAPASTRRSCSPAARRAPRPTPPTRSPRTWPTRWRRWCSRDAAY